MSQQWERCFYFDIETVPLYSATRLTELPSDLQAALRYKGHRLLSNSGVTDASPEAIDVRAEQFWNSDASFFPQYSKICSIAIGIPNFKGETYAIRSYTSENEKEVLISIVNLLEKLQSGALEGIRFIPSGYNILDFDLPFLQSRLMVNELPIPSCINTIGKAPWKVLAKDLALFWGKRYSSLIEVATALGLPSPKELFDGSQVKRVFYQHQYKDHQGVLQSFPDSASALNAIGKYCEADVMTVMQIANKIMKYEE
jgi:hypothetical protein